MIKNLLEELRHIIYKSAPLEFSDQIINQWRKRNKILYYDK